MALKSLLGLAGVACGNSNCVDKELGMEGEGGLDTESWSVSAEHGSSN